MSDIENKIERILRESYDDFFNFDLATANLTELFAAENAALRQQLEAARVVMEELSTHREHPDYCQWWDAFDSEDCDCGLD